MKTPSQHQRPIETGGEAPPSFPSVTLMLNDRMERIENMLLDLHKIFVSEERREACLKMAVRNYIRGDRNALESFENRRKR